MAPRNAPTALSKSGGPRAERGDCLEFLGEETVRGTSRWLYRVRQPGLKFDMAAPQPNEDGQMPTDEVHNRVSARHSTVMEGGYPTLAAFQKAKSKAKDLGFESSEAYEVTKARYEALSKQNGGNVGAAALDYQLRLHAKSTAHIRSLLDKQARATKKASASADLACAQAAFMHAGERLRANSTAQAVQVHMRAQLGETSSERDERRRMDKLVRD